MTYNVFGGTLNLAQFKFSMKIITLVKMKSLARYKIAILIPTQFQVKTPPRTHVSRVVHTATLLLN